MKRIQLSIVILAAFAAYVVPVARAAAPEKTVLTEPDNSINFRVTEIVASPGQKLHIVLHNEGTLPKATMGHDWVLLKAGSDATAYAVRALSAQAEGYMPKSLSNEVIASIPLLGPKEVGEVTFDAPAKPGHYPYICSCSGHSMAGMRGELIVK